jgi:hypothetical protein
MSFKTQKQNDIGTVNFNNKYTEETMLTMLVPKHLQLLTSRTNSPSADVSTQ